MSTARPADAAPIEADGGDPGRRTGGWKRLAHDADGGGRMQVPTMQGTMDTRGGLEYTNGSKKVVVHGYRLTHVGHVAKLTAVVNGHRILVATMAAPHMKMSGKTGRMSGALKLSAAWARLINHLVGKQVVHPSEHLGDLNATMKMT